MQADTALPTIAAAQLAEAHGGKPWTVFGVFAVVRVSGAWGALGLYRLAQQSVPAAALNVKASVAMLSCMVFAGCSREAW